MSRALNAEGSGISFGQQYVGRALLTPDKVRMLSADRQLLFLAGHVPLPLPDPDAGYGRFDDLDIIPDFPWVPRPA